MPALLILNYDVHDAAALDQYRMAAAPILIDEAAGELIASTEETISLPEGQAAGTHTVVLRFASPDAATDVYESEAYRPLLLERLRVVSPRFAAVVPVP